MHTATLLEIAADEYQLLPAVDDLRVSAASLVELQRLYKLNTTKLINGELQLKNISNDNNVPSSNGTMQSKGDLLYNFKISNFILEKKNEVQDFHTKIK